MQGDGIIFQNKSYSVEQRQRRRFQIYQDVVASECEKPCGQAAFFSAEDII